MTDLLTRMRSAATLGAAIDALDEGAAEIENLRHDLDRSMAREYEFLQEVEGLRAALAATDHLYDEIGGVRTCYEFDDDPAAWTAMAVARNAALAGEKP